MIELIVFGRLISDYLWDYKALSVAHSILSVLLAIFVLVNLKKSSVKICNTDRMFLVFIAFAIIALAKNPTDDSIIIFLKTATYLSIYFAGRIIPPNMAKAKLLGACALVLLACLAIYALSGKGYETRGSVSTFTGGYFFKTDLAISALILLAIAFTTLTNKLLLTLSLIFSAFLIFKSNARIALPLVLILPAISIMIPRGNLTKISFKAIASSLLFIIIGMALFTLIDFQALGMLGFDFSDPYSASNTQGRSVIWGAILQAYSDASIADKFTGMGFDADTIATAGFTGSENIEGLRAHNSYLYLLICMGIFGSLSFYSLLYSAFSKIHFIITQKNKNSTRIATLSTSLLIIFIWLSMTTEIVIRPQLMVPLFFFTGLHVQLYLKHKKIYKD